MRKRQGDQTCKSPGRHIPAPGRRRPVSGRCDKAHKVVTDSGLALVGSENNTQSPIAMSARHCGRRQVFAHAIDHGPRAAGDGHHVVDRAGVDDDDFDGALDAGQACRLQGLIRTMRQRLMVAVVLAGWAARTAAKASASALSGASLLA
jgi:hypothetical protein